MPHRIFAVFLLLFLVSCINPVDATATPAMLNTQVIPTSPATVPTSSPTAPLPTLTSTSQASCDPFQADFCVTEGHFMLQRPIHPPANDLVDGTYRYGSNADGARDPHHGVEFGNPGGTPVHAAADGIVLFAGPDEDALYSPWPNFYGNLVVIEHAGDLFTLYAHLSKTSVQSGQQVFVGEKIGEVGMTGVAIGSHLHFEVRRGDVQDYFATQNPELWLSPAEDPNGYPLGALMISVVNQSHELVKLAGYTIRYQPDQTGQSVKTYYGTTYPSDMLHGNENAGLGDLPAGNYRIAVEYNGKVYERWAEVKSGKLTQVVIFVK